jgi:hypothetical protein
MLDTETAIVKMKNKKDDEITAEININEGIGSEL